MSWIQGLGSLTRMTLSASAVKVERLESITVTRPGSVTRLPRYASHSAGPSSINRRVVGSNGLSPPRFRKRVHSWVARLAGLPRGRRPTILPHAQCAVCLSLLVVRSRQCREQISQFVLVVLPAPHRLLIERPADLVEVAGVIAVACGTQARGVPVEAERGHEAPGDPFEVGDGGLVIDLVQR